MNWLTVLTAFGGLGGVIAALVQTVRLKGAQGERDALRVQLDAAQKAAAQISADGSDKIARGEAIIAALKVEITKLEESARLAADADPMVLRERLKRILAGGAAVLVLVLLPILLPGCRHVEYVPAVLDRPCLIESPPVAAPVTLSGPAEGCPDQWVGCLDTSAAFALVGNVNAARRWMTEAWLRCGPTPAKVPP